MRMINILGGVASSAVIAAMAVVYSTAPREANASIGPIDEINLEYGTTPMVPLMIKPNLVEVSDYLANDLAPERSPRPPERPVPHLPDLVNKADQQYCLAQNIYFEARGESHLGQEAVAWVTLNRVMDPDRPKTICAVVWEDNQFSWTNDGLRDTPPDGEAWDAARAVAADVTANWNPDHDPTEGSVMFHSSDVKPEWRKSFSKVVRIDGHIFYNNG